MKILAMERGLGKTSTLARLSEQNGIPIIVHSKVQANNLKKLYPSAQFFTVEELPYLNTSKGIYVDDLEHVLRDLFKAEVIMSTITV